MVLGIADHYIQIPCNNAEVGGVVGVQAQEKIVRTSRTRDEKSALLRYFNLLCDQTIYLSCA